jgi:hypothetical protein
MEDFIEFLKTVLAILAIVIFITIGMLFYASGKVENSYQIALKSMDQGKWDIALSNFEQIPNYKDASNLYTFAYPHKIYYGNYKSINETIYNYNEALAFINYNKSNLKSSNSSKYASDLSELEKVLKFNIVVLNVNKQNMIIQKNFDDSVQLIKNGDYQNALQKLNIISDSGLYGSDKKQLISYINLQNTVQFYNESIQNKEKNKKNISKEILSIIYTLNPNYTGPLNQEIKKTVQTLIDITKWNEVYNNDKKKNDNLSNITETPKLALGMKEESILQILGNPLKQNIISNKYGVFKELTFSNDAIVYFKDNTSIAIKD